jgi:hypothetical protein
LWIPTNPKEENEPQWEQSPWGFAPIAVQISFLNEEVIFLANQTLRIVKMRKAGRQEGRKRGE